MVVVFLRKHGEEKKLQEETGKENKVFLIFVKLPEREPFVKIF